VAHSPPAPGANASTHEVDHFRRRVRLYVLIMLIMDIGARVSDVVGPLFVDDLTMPDYPLFTRVVRWAVTIGLVAAWLLARFAKPGRLVLVALEGCVTIGLSLVYIHIASIHMGGALSPYAQVFAMFGIMLLLGVRASLVPSPVVRTVIIGGVSVAALFVIAKDAINALDPLVVDGLSYIGGAYVIATAVTSHVIYGLRREVRRALQLGQYTLREKLGEGGMGTVYRAQHAMLQREAAIKLVKPELSADGPRYARVLERFKREAHVTANLKSQNTIQLYDFGVSDEGAFYYVMELLDGINLEVAVANYGPMPPDRVIFLLRQVCESLEEAHAAGLVHRDIKPANIVLCRHGVRHDFVKVLDFGLVTLGPQAEKLDPKLTAEGFAGGTPAYIAPEMAVSADTVDGRADIYALGGVAYWLLSGHAPFERETAMATIMAHVNDAPAPPSSVSEIAIPGKLEALVLECLEKKPTDRPASAAELSRRLKAVSTTDIWDQERAARWWEAHKPAREEAHSSSSQEAAVKVTKALQ